MSELTERLRNRIHDSQMDNEHLMDDAIEALEAQEAKIAALEKALHEIAAHEPSSGNHNLNDLIAHASVKAASKALTPSLPK